MELGRDFRARGWALGTSGNYSAVTCRQPLHVALTVSGVDKGKLTGDDILVIDERQQILEGNGRPSAESRLHRAVARLTGAGAVLHTHSVWSTILSETAAARGGLVIEGFGRSRAWKKSRPICTGSGFPSSRTHRTMTDWSGDCQHAGPASFHRTSRTSWRSSTRPEARG